MSLFAPFAGGACVLAAAAFPFVLCGTAAAQCTTAEFEKVANPGAFTGSDRFGIATWLDGDTLIVGESGQDVAHVYRRVAGAWAHETELWQQTSDANDFGVAVAIEGEVALVGSGDILDDSCDNDDEDCWRGRAWIFRHANGVWSEEAMLFPAAFQDPDSRYGARVALGGGVALIGAPGDGTGSAFVFRESGGSWLDEATLKAPGGAIADSFGDALAIDGNVVVVGAPADDDLGAQSGSAHVFRYSGGAWVHEAKLTASDGGPEDFFGRSVAVEGDVIVVGAHGQTVGGTHTGAAYVYRKSGGAWVQEAKLNASDAELDDAFGSSVALDEGTILVGAYGDDDGGSWSGSGYVFRSVGGQWLEQAKINASDAAQNRYFGWCAALDDGTAMIGAPEYFNGATGGAVYTYEGIGDCNGNAQLDVCDILGGTSADNNADGEPDECDQSCDATEFAKLAPAGATQNDESGAAVALGGDSAAVGAPGDGTGSVTMFRWDGAWMEEQTVKPDDGATGDSFGYAVGADGEVVVVGSPSHDGKGAAYIYRRGQNGWVEEAELLASDGAIGHRFGASVDIDADRVLVGAPGHNGQRGAAYAFTFSSGTWTQEAKLVANDGASGDEFGYSVRLDGDGAAIGAPRDDDRIGGDVGAAYVFRLVGGGWQVEDKVQAADRAANDLFGLSVDLAGSLLVVGANNDDDMGTASGSAYAFRGVGGQWEMEQKFVAEDGVASDNFGESVGAEGDFVVIGARQFQNGGPGGAYVYMYGGAGWALAAKLHGSDTAADDRFGSAVALHDGRALVGAPRRALKGAAYMFHGVSDCNGNARLDLCDIAAGSSEDADGTGFPDECECVADFNGDDTVNTQDVLAFLNAWTAQNPEADINGDGVINTQDVLAFLNEWNAGCA